MAVVVQSLSYVQLFVTSWTTACQAPLSSPISQVVLLLSHVRLLWPLANCSLPGSSVHGILKNTVMGCHCLLQGIFPMQESNPGLLHCRQILYRLSYEGSPAISQSCSNSCPLSQWCCLTISCSVIPLLLLPSIYLLPDASQHQGAKVLELRLQQHSFQWIFRVDFL